jgi:diguanylate cyclase (GGDEF)-like protein
MTVKAERTIFETGNQGGVSGAMVTVLIGRVYAHNGDVGVAQTLALAGDGRPFSTLADLTSWSSLAEAIALFNAAALVTGDGAIGIHVGEELLFRADGTDFVDRLWSLGSPEVAFKHIGPLLEHFDTSAEAVALRVAGDHALVRVTPRTTTSRHAHLCEMTRGLLTQVPALYGLGTAVISEAECSARGGRHCEYAVSWEDLSIQVPEDPSGVPPWDTPAGTAPGRPDDGPEPRPTVADVTDVAVTELQRELDRMSMLVDGAFATANELLGDDADSLLTAIAARADAVVGADRFLLVIRARPGAPLQLHSRGLEPDEAQAIAAELWRDPPDDGGGTRLIVDIASPRHLYGRLAEILPPGQSSPHAESALLRRYADHAASALDIFTVLTDAKQSDATARTLLSFSEAVSRVTNLADLVQVLADTVPAVTDCDYSTVYLWDREQGRLLPRARTMGMDPTYSFLGPIVPVSRTEPSSVVPPATVTEGNGTAVAGDAELRIPTNAAMIGRAIHERQVLVLDEFTEDPLLRTLLEESRTKASVVAPLFANGEFLGVIAANFGAGASVANIRDADLHERLSGVADQAATALQNLELLERVSHLAWHDALTGLPNRRLFEDRVEQELVRSRRVGEPVCMFFVDLDHFKFVNDTLGHAAGDDLIRQVSQRLVDTVRRQDTVARVGGDEFAILLPGLSEQLAINELAQRSLEAMNSAFEVLGEEVRTSASIGIAMAPDHGDSYDELLSRADEAMYRAKARGRNAFQMFSGSTSGTMVVDEQTLGADLVRALERGEFFVLYQPYVDLRTAQVVGVEALVRWDHPTLGILEPSSFIALAERSNIIVALDSWVLAEACAQARTWLDDGLKPLRLSVNLASRDLADPDLFANVERTLEATGLDPTHLELEITERVVLDRTGPAKENVERLRRLGVRFSIDDFGTGNSSLDRIGSFPVSTLKIDQTFVQVLGPDGDNNALVSAIISMADRLGLACVAEGVETSLQSRMLLQRGCTTAQGYFFSPPLPPDEIEALMENIANGDGPMSFGDSVR